MSTISYDRNQNRRSMKKDPFSKKYGIYQDTDSILFVPKIPFLRVDIEKVIFNGPATIVFWSDGIKTIVKCTEDDIYDQEKGLAMAICKRVLGDNFKKTFKEHIEEENETYNNISAPCSYTFVESIHEIHEKLKKLSDDFKKL